MIWLRHSWPQFCRSGQREHSFGQRGLGKEGSDVRFSGSDANRLPLLRLRASDQALSPVNEVGTNPRDGTNQKESDRHAQDPECDEPNLGAT